MASSMTTDAHGVRVVTHIIPLDTPAPPCPSKREQTLMDEPSLPYITRMFLKGEPVALGTVQVFIGAVIMALGIIVWVAGILHGEISLVLGISCLICGSVTLAARNGTCPRLIKTTLALNIISTLLAIAGICYFCFELAKTPVMNDREGEDVSFWQFYYIRARLRNLLYGLNGVLLVLSVLEVCICTTLVVFSCKASCKAPKTKMVVKVQTTDSCQSLLSAGDPVGSSEHPPAYEP